MCGKKACGHLKSIISTRRTIWSTARKLSFLLHLFIPAHFNLNEKDPHRVRKAPSCSPSPVQKRRNKKHSLHASIRYGFDEDFFNTPQSFPTFMRRFRQRSASMLVSNYSSAPQGSWIVKQCVGRKHASLTRHLKSIISTRRTIWRRLLRRGLGGVRQR
ncbi:uncharacterized protein LOC126600751 isoform X1 [Malus sylvestris]|uniref:uncharacterized protein LOC126600751 isoform X1 n=1 Tax=Malus sylvestris TaxID=3752 RepID=UPI0021AC5F12|nr:uncharacterized protein LOC126600751 isoform X1 [Malus sylvestris]